MKAIAENKDSTSNMDAETQGRYIKAREIIDAKVESIISISLIFSAFEQWPDDRISISPYALGKLNQQINREACALIAALEDFAKLNRVKQTLKQLKGER